MPKLVSVPVSVVSNRNWFRRTPYWGHESYWSWDGASFQNRGAHDQANYIKVFWAFPPLYRKWKQNSDKNSASELFVTKFFSVPRDDSERNSVSFLSRETGGIPKKQWSIPFCFVFREKIVLLEIWNPIRVVRLGEAGKPKGEGEGMRLGSRERICSIL